VAIRSAAADAMQMPLSSAAGVGWRLAKEAPMKRQLGKAPALVLDPDGRCPSLSDAHPLRPTPDPSGGKRYLLQSSSAGTDFRRFCARNADRASV